MFALVSLEINQTISIYPDRLAAEDDLSLILADEPDWEPVLRIVEIVWPDDSARLMFSPN